MLQYKNHRFYIGSVSLEIPDGYYLNNEPEYEMQIGLFLISAGQDYSLNLD